MKTVVNKLFIVLLGIVGLSVLISCQKSSSPPIDKGEEGQFVKLLGSKVFTAANMTEGMADDMFDINAINELSNTVENNPSGWITYSYKVDAITYTTKGVDGKKIDVSGIIAYPTDIDKFRGVVLCPMYTITSDAECPSRSLNTPYNFFASLGYVVITPDYIGFNLTKEKTHPYLHREVTGRVCADMVLAARTYMKGNNTPIENGIYIVGFSQGAASALMAQRMIEEKYSNIPVFKVYAGAGPHDLKGTYDNYCKSRKTGFPCSVPYVVLGLNEGDRLNLDLSKMFKENLFKNYKLWYLSKNYNSTQINGFLGNNEDISSYMQDEMFNTERKGDFLKLYQSCERNSNIDWTPKAPVILYHSKGDEAVPYFNSENAAKSFRDKGANVEFNTLNNMYHVNSGKDFFVRVYTRFAL